MHFHKHFSFSCYNLRKKIAIHVSHIFLDIICADGSVCQNIFNCKNSVSSSRNPILLVCLFHCPDFVRLFHTFLPPRSVEPTKQRMTRSPKLGEKCDIIDPDLVGQFHTSTSLISVELSKERERFLGWGKSAKKCDIILTLLCQTIPHSLPFPYPDSLSARFARRFFSAHAGFSSFFS